MYNDLAEVQLVSGASEMDHWVSLGKAQRYPSDDSIIDGDTLFLQPGEYIELLFKFQTFREVDFEAKMGSLDIIKPRQVKINFFNSQ